MGAMIPLEPAPTLPVVSQQNETGATVLAARAKAEVEARALVAMHRPRNIDQFRLRLLQACQRTRFAETARYAKPVGRSKVTGMSIRFAAEAARQFTNLDISTMVVSEDDERRVIKVTVVDLEANLPWSAEVVIAKTVERRSKQEGDEVLRQRLNSQGIPVYILRATEDDLLVKQNAAVAKAVRNLVLNVIPSDIVEEAEETIAKTLRSADQQDPAGQRKRLVDAFFALGVMPPQIEAVLGHSLEAITPAQLQLLRSIYTAMKEEGVAWSQVSEEFGAKKSDGESSGTGSKLRDKLAKKPAPTAPSASPAAEVPAGVDLATGEVAS